MNRNLDIEIKVGIFVVIGMALTCFALILAGGDRSLFESKVEYKVKYAQVDGLGVGSGVKIAGYKIGAIQDMAFQENGDVELTIKVLKRFSSYIHEDSVAGTGTQGVLGDKYIALTVGTPGTPLVPAGGFIKAETPKNLKDYMSKGDEIIDNLNKNLSDLQYILSSFRKEGRADVFFKNLSTMATNMSTASKELPQSTKEFQNSIQHFKNILSKVDHGEGTLGALINDPTLYDDLKNLLGGANRNRVLKFFIKKSVESSRDASKQKQSEDEKAAQANQ